MVKSERGIALALVLMALVVSGALIAGILLGGTQEQRVADQSATPSPPGKRDGTVGQSTNWATTCT